MHSTQRMRAGFGAAFAVLLGVGIAAILRTYEWDKNSAWITHSLELSARLEQLSGLTKGAEATARELADRYEASHALQLTGISQNIHATLTEIDKLARENATQASIQRRVRTWTSMQGELLNSAASSEPRDRVRRILADYDGSGVSAQIAHAIAMMLDEERRSLTTRMTRQQGTASAARWLFSAACLLSFGLVLFAGWQALGDQDKRNLAESALHEKEDQYRQVVEMAGDLIYRTDKNGRFTYCNLTGLKVLHWTEDEVIGRSYLKFIRQDKRKEVGRFFLRQMARKKKNCYYEFVVIDGHGHERWLGQNMQPTLGPGGITGFQAIARDITDRKRGEAELNRSRIFAERIAATTPGILYVFDLIEHRNIFSNREIISVLGYGQQEIDFSTGGAADYFHPDDLHAIRAHHESLRHAPDGEVRRLEYRVRHKNGHWVWLASRDTPFDRSPDGLVKQIVGIAQDITAVRAAQDELIYQANYDALTGLANRQYFWKRMQGVVRRTTLEHSITSLCLVDIDNFKEINDRHGHSAGDEVLEALGLLLRNELRSRDISGRLGGDEFCFVLPDTGGNEAMCIAERVLERLRTQAFGMTHGTPFTVTATFGIAEWRPGMDARELMDTADKSLYRGKMAGRNRVCVDL